MSKPTMSERFRYWFDNWMSRGTLALMALLAIATGILVLVVGVVVWVFRQTPEDNPELSFGDILWGNLMRTLDPGTMGGDAGWGFRIFMLLITIGGLIIVASLIGIISGAFDAKVDELRKGRSKVLEKDHTLILGWNSKVIPIVSEICIANESRRGAVIVVLADRDKVEMEDELKAKVATIGRTKIICRTGDPMSLTDLEIANPATSRSVIILASDDSPDADADAIKTALALTNNPRRRPEPYHIVAELTDVASLEAATLVGRDEAHWVLGSDLIGRITVQSCRQSGLSVVYSELLDFDGDEIYFTDQPQLHGKTYFETQLSFADSAVMGIVSAGSVLLNPQPDTVYSAGDQLIVIAEDDSTIRLAKPGVVDVASINVAPSTRPTPEHTLVLGYNSGLTRIFGELNNYVAPGSTATVLADVESPDFPALNNLAVTFQSGDATNRALLDGLGVERFDHIIVLAYKDGMDAQRSDGRTLITLLQLRDIAERAGIQLNIVSEMLDDRNRELAEVTDADDFIVSDQLISRILSQVSENKNLIQVFDSLFTSEGSEVYLYPVENYLAPGSTVDFYTVLEAARRRGETALGYRIASRAHSAKAQYGIVLNPTKAEWIEFVPGDQVVVLAEG